MHSIKSHFEGKNITVMGLGVLGRGVGDVAFLAECGAKVLVTDLKTQDQLSESVARLKQYKNVSFHLGGHIQEDFTSCDIVLKAAGVPLDSPFIAAARAASVPVVMSTALFVKYAREAGVIVVGVTGTRGKSTTTHMIYETLRTAGKKVVIGGNVRGVSTLALLDECKDGYIAVLELDSWQLQGFGDLSISPDIAVFTNLMPDHQNYYPNSDIYFADKANIFMHQVEGSTLVVGRSIEQRIRAANPPVEPAVATPIPEDWHLRVVGLHNRENASLAAAALRALDVSPEEIRRGIESFAGVEGRLQFVREINGIKVYNDNNATTPDATVAALQALASPDKKIILIMGGADKGLDMGMLLLEIKKTCKQVILISGSGTNRIMSLIADHPIYENLAEALHAAMQSASPGDVLLFSPAFASFGMFKNEYDRNDQFMGLVNSI